MVLDNKTNWDNPFNSDSTERFFKGFSLPLETSTPLHRRGNSSSFAGFGGPNVAELMPNTVQDLRRVINNLAESTTVNNAESGLKTIGKCNCTECNEPPDSLESA